MHYIVDNGRGLLFEVILSEEETDKYIKRGYKLTLIKEL